MPTVLVSSGNSPHQAVSLTLPLSFSPKYRRAFMGAFFKCRGSRPGGALSAGTLSPGGIGVSANPSYHRSVAGSEPQLPASASWTCLIMNHLHLCKSIYIFSCLILSTALCTCMCTCVCMCCVLCACLCVCCCITYIVCTCEYIVCLCVMCVYA